LRRQNTSPRVGGNTEIRQRDSGRLAVALAARWSDTEQHAQNRIGAGVEAELEARRNPAYLVERSRSTPITHHDVGLATIGCSEFREPLGEDLATTIGPSAIDAPREQINANAGALARRIAKGSIIATVDVTGAKPQTGHEAISTVAQARISVAPLLCQTLSKQRHR
jgi:hypothetical protein